MVMTQGTTLRLALAAVRSAFSQAVKMPWKAGSPVGSTRYESSKATLMWSRAHVDRVEELGVLRVIGEVLGEGEVAVEEGGVVLVVAVRRQREDLAERGVLAVRVLPGVVEPLFPLALVGGEVDHVAREELERDARGHQAQLEHLPGVVGLAARVALDGDLHRGGAGRRRGGEGVDVAPHLGAGGPAADAVAVGRRRLETAHVDLVHPLVAVGVDGAGRRVPGMHAGEAVRGRRATARDQRPCPTPPRSPACPRRSARPWRCWWRGRRGPWRRGPRCRGGARGGPGGCSAWRPRWGPRAGSRCTRPARRWRRRSSAARR